MSQAPFAAATDTRNAQSASPDLHWYGRPGPASRTWIVTRHPGAQQWLRSQGWEGTLVPHLEPRVLQPGDCVIGTVPLHLAAIISAVGARYLYLSMEVPPELRGCELTPKQMAQCGARLEEFLVRRLPTPTSLHAR